ncbi:sugar ABC transporter permease [Micromonospora sp. NPDC048169]|uniref:sugar ABC transporter permease n=1 Tax=unclassified Micromonospora TaxID=2617518 RepID=UPI0033C010D2
MTTIAETPTPTGTRTPARRSRSRWFAQVGWRHLVGVVAVAFSLFPILFVISAAFNPLGTLSSTELLPTGASLENFTNLFDNTAFGHWFLNSLLLAGVASFASIFLSSLAAYAFSRMRFAGRRVGLLALLLIQMFPQFLAIVAIFLIFTTLTDLYPAIGFNTPWGLFLLYMGGALGANTWLMKGFFDTLPKELDESATMDGASHVQVFFRIMLPLVAPILAVTGLLAFIGSINEFIIANVFLTEPESKTLAVGMFGLVAGERNNNFGMFAAGTLLTAIPTVLVFQLLQRYIVSGLTSGAVKG